MNDPNKKIDVNISSLLSLKAELLRKQQEVNKAKTRQQTNEFVPKSFPKSTASVRDTDESNQPKTIPHDVDLEDNEQLAQSRRVLEAKAKFYDKMTVSGGVVNSDESCLVMFNKKKQDDKPLFNRSSSEDDDDSETEPYDSTKDSNDDWVEYVDCLGRTRQCLKKDLKFFIKKDTSLADNLKERLAQQDKDNLIPEEVPEATLSLIEDQVCSDGEESEEDELLKTGRKLQQMREQWDKQEDENKHKDFVHYQDVLFNEARTHGVGYYQFSTDMEERAKQQKELEAQRRDTLATQKERDTQRTAREKIIAARVRAAKNRQRARLGLPPLSEDAADETAAIADEKAGVVEQEKKDAVEMEEFIKDLERRTHVRPWDVGKSGANVESVEKEWTYKAQKEPMSQEQWNESKREERKKEFAPTQELSAPSREPTAVHHHAPDTTYYDDEEESKGLYFSSKRKFKPRSYQPSTDETEDRTSAGTEIPPPPTFDYYGPSTSQPKRPKCDAQNLETSIEAGLKFLRNQSDKSQPGTKSKWTANADY